MLVWSPINFCPPDNENLPCPAPTGAVAPWHPSPQELALPAAAHRRRAIQLGSNFLYIGGSDGKAAQSTVYVARTSGTGNFDAWTEGPALPEPRSDASVLLVSGSIYVIGGYGADGAPTKTVFILTPNGTTGALGEWQVAKDILLLPEARAGAAAVSAPTGVLLIGGTGPDGAPVTTVWKAPLADDGTLEAWTDQASLLHPQADGAGWLIGDYVWVWGGHDQNGAVGAVQRGHVAPAVAAGLPPDPQTGQVVQWSVSDSANLPAARDNAATWSANGALYLVGGQDATGKHGELYWTTPTPAGDLPGWSHLEASDLPFGLTGGAAMVSGPNAIIVGGETDEGVTTSSARANVAPMSPFFQLGLAGATIPGLKIEGEIGQQLGYLNAAGAGTVNFIILLLVGWGFAHQEQARGMIRRVLRR